MASERHICVDCLALPEAERPRRVRPTDVAEHPRAPRCATHRRERKTAQRARGRATAAQRLYGCTPDDESALRAACGNLCPVCGFLTGKKPRVRDHNHRTGALRGLICNDCNRIIGRWGDDPRVAERLAAYLRDPPAARILVDYPEREWSAYRGSR